VNKAQGAGEQASSAYVLDVLRVGEQEELVEGVVQLDVGSLGGGDQSVHSALHLLRFGHQVARKLLEVVEQLHHHEEGT
jgi:hypothetical protein